MSIAALICAAGVLVACTNVITQVVKQVTKDVCSTNIVAFIVAEALTIISGSIYCRGQGIETDVLAVLVLILAGFAVAYGAMFGYDKLKEAMDWNGDEGQDEQEENEPEGLTDLLTEFADAFEETGRKAEIVAKKDASALEDMTKAELKAMLDQMGISYTSKNTKAELIALVLGE